MGYTIDATESGCYPGTTVLVNKFDLRSQSELDAVEAALVTAKAIQWEEAPLCDSFDFAGQVRTINISKKGTQFCPAEELPRVGEAVFARVRKEHFFCGLSRERFAEELLDLYERTNELHPFREGNGRTQRVFLAQLAQNAGYRLDFSCVDADELMIATIYAAQGIDLPLKDVLDKIIKE